MRLALLLFVALFTAGGAAQTPKPSTYRWTQFVQVDGQPEPVPAEWVSTPEGKLAHSIKIPNPVPKDSGYRPGMSSKEYFEHLCKSEAGEFIFKTVDNVDGFYFMRPPKRPTDKDLMDRYKLEAPDIERMFQLYGTTVGDRSTIFVNSGEYSYIYVEEKSRAGDRFEKAFGYEKGTTRTKPTVEDDVRRSNYGLIWRGIRRTADRDNAIAGNEWIVLDISNGNVLAVFRNFARTGGVRNVTDGIWWLNAVQCPGSRRIVSAGSLGDQISRQLNKVLRPTQGLQE